jgi:hypothetical protein
MADCEWHKIFTEEFEEAEMVAYGALMGWMAGKGEARPSLTPVLREALGHAFAAAFNAGAEAARSDFSLEATDG